MRLISLFLSWVVAVLSVTCLSVSSVAHAQRAPADAASAEYKFGSGDVVRISVYQNPDLTLEVRISENGAVSFPLLGSIRLGGLSVSQGEKLIADGLRSGNFVKQPQVNINVMQVRGNQASVLGQVGRPGRYPLELADVRLTDLLALAGGIAATGADTVVIVGNRDGKPFRSELDLRSIFEPGNRDKGDVQVQNGDVVFVDRAPVVYVYGEVQRPGTVRLERGMTLMQVLASAGGVTQRGTQRGMQVHRRDSDGKVSIIEPKMTDALRVDDVVYVRESVF